MITRAEQRKAQAYAADQLEALGVVLTAAERESIEVADFGLSRVLREVGPLLDQHGYVATPAATRFATAAELLASLTASIAGDADTPTT